MLEELPYARKQTPAETFPGGSTSAVLTEISKCALRANKYVFKMQCSHMFCIHGILERGMNRNGALFQYSGIQKFAESAHWLAKCCPLSGKFRVRVLKFLTSPFVCLFLHVMSKK